MSSAGRARLPWWTGREEATGVPNTIEITLTLRGFEVTTAGRVTRFPSIEDALDYAQQRLRRAEDLRELSRRCE